MSVASVEPEALARTIDKQVDEAMAWGAVESRTFVIAHAPIVMTVAQEVAPFLFTPFAHLQSHDAREPVLRVDVATLHGNDRLAKELEAIPDSGVVLSDADTIVHLHRDAVSRFDRSSGHVRALVHNVDGVASWQRAKPLQLPLSIFFADRGVDLVHAGLVSLHGNGVLIVGAGGSGKSTTTVASLFEGLDFLGDDCVAVQEIDGTFEGSSIYGSSCLEREHLTRFRQALPDDRFSTFNFQFSISASGRKDVLSIASLLADQMTASTRIRAIVLPHVMHGEHVIVRPASGKEALLALAPSSILKRAVPAAAALGRMARLVRAVPAFHLEMGPIAEVGPRMRTLLEELGS